MRSQSWPAGEGGLSKKYQVFISSTFTDLVEERKAVYEMCLRMGHIPLGMERFNANDESQWDVIKRTIDECDYYCIIVAWKYGSIDHDGVSFTEKEYDYAVEKQIPVMRFLLDEEANWPRDKSPPADQNKVEQFRQKLKTGRMVRFWKDAKDLASEFNLTFADEMRLRPRLGWIRSNDASIERATHEVMAGKEREIRLAAELGAKERELLVLKQQIQNISKRGEERINKEIAESMKQNYLTNVDDGKRAFARADRILFALHCSNMDPFQADQLIEIINKCYGEWLGWKEVDVRNLLNDWVEKGLVKKSLSKERRHHAGELRSTYKFTELGVSVAKYLESFDDIIDWAII